MGCKKINILFPFLKGICRAFVWMKMERIYRENALCTFVQKVRSERRSKNGCRGFVCTEEGTEARCPAPGSAAFFSMLREYSVTTEPRKVSVWGLHQTFLMVILRRFDCFLIYTVFQLKCWTFVGDCSTLKVHSSEYILPVYFYVPAHSMQLMIRAQSLKLSASTFK